jgi:hypothetical protein
MLRLATLGASVVCAFVAVTRPPAVGADEQSQTPPAAAAPQTVDPELWTGTWDYNDAESVDAATGRPERAPRGATQRSAAQQAGVGTGGQGRGGGGGAAGGGGGRGFGGGQAMTAQMLREIRGMLRDLIEIAETFTITVQPDAVTFVDDLERERTYPTTGDKRKYQLGAAQFSARVRWDGAQLRKEIEGEYGFKMTETFFLSADGKKLFLVLRIGDPKRKDLPIIGANRVYDRISQ